MTNSNDNDSKYQSLHCFLKYATATSTSINSMLLIHNLISLRI